MLRDPAGRPNVGLYRRMQTLSTFFSILCGSAALAAIAGIYSLKNHPGASIAAAAFRVVVVVAAAASYPGSAAEYYLGQICSTARWR